MAAFFNNIGHELGVFFDHTLPRAVHDVGGFFNRTVIDVSKTTGQVIQNVVKPVVNVGQDVVKTAGSEIRQTLPVVAQSTRSVASGLAEVTTSIQWPLVAGIGVAGLLVLKYLR